MSEHLFEPASGDPGDPLDPDARRDAGHDRRGDPGERREHTADAPAAPFAAEALRVVAAVQDWARTSFPEPGVDGHTGPECQWCPLCQFVAVLRGERPELTERVAEAGAALASAVKAVVDAAAAGPSARDGGAPPARPRVQRIDLDEPDRTDEPGPADPADPAHPAFEDR